MDAVARLALLQSAMLWMNQTQPTDLMERMTWIGQGAKLLEELGGNAPDLAPKTDIVKQAQKELTYTAKLEYLRDFMSLSQYKVVKGAGKTEFSDIVDRLYALITKMPKTYEQDGAGNDAVVSLHYFAASSDWWITEKDMEGVGTVQAFGFACLNNDWQNAELGYIGLDQLLATNRVELDFHFDPVSLGKIRETEGKQSVGDGDTESRPKDIVDGIERLPMTDDQKAQQYAHREKVTKGQRQKENIAAAKLLSKLIGDAQGLQAVGGSTETHQLTADEQIALSKYSGNGGGLTDSSGKQGSDYEYYTPKPVAQAIWDLLGEYGFSAGSALDPAGGTGIFGATAPKNTLMDSVELDYTSGNINRLLNDSATHRVTVSNFEKQAANTPDGIYDVVATNVPFSSQVNARGDNYKDDPMYQDETLDAYFLLRSLDKVRAGGLGAFIVPTRYVSGVGNTHEKLRIRTQLKAEFLGAWRLPNKVFNNAGTDVATDIIIFRKYSKEARETIDALYNGEGIAQLYESRVLDDSIISGHYFRDEGKHFVIGEFQARDKTKMRDVDHYITDESVANIAKLIRKFPDSRVDLSILGAVAVDLTQYDEGDVIVRHGQTWIMQDDQWQPLGNKSVTPLDTLRGYYTTARDAYMKGMDGDPDQAIDYVSRERVDAIPDWLGIICRDLRNVDTKSRKKLLTVLMLAYAVQEGIQQNGLQSGFDYTNGQYADVSFGLSLNAKILKSATKSKDLGADNKAVLSRSLVALNPNYKSGSEESEFSVAWRGLNLTDNTVALVAGLDERSKYERLRYNAKDPRGVSVENMKEIDPNFDVHTNDDFCLSDDGQHILSADDYFIGNVATLQNRLLAAIEATDDQMLKDKLTRQLTLSRARYTPFDTSRMTFDLLSRYVTLEMKTRYLKQYVSDKLVLTYSPDGKAVIDIVGTKEQTNFNSRWWRTEYIQRQVARYVYTGGALTVLVRVSDEEKAVLVKESSEAVKRANAQFNSWVKAQPDFVAKLQKEANSPENLNFDVLDDTTPLAIDGFDPSRTIAGFTLNAYQNSEIRRMSRRFSGITGFDVGLGKTLTALAAVQHVQNLGVKKKTVFVVPNGVLSNWRKEATTAYDSLDDCLFVGLNFNAGTGKFEVNSKDYERDIVQILNNQHSKIFMTYEAFTNIPMMDSTLDDYKEYVGMVDSAYSNEDMTRAKHERNKAKLSRVASGAAAGGSQFFEDLGIDSVVIDEFHSFKNAKTPDQFKGAKYLSIPKEAARALDMNAKLWYVRDGSVQDDGVMALTATPITNSPLEIYSMLALAEGEAAVNRGMMGIQGADAFLETFAEIELQDYEGVDGVMRTGRVFTGLKNLDVLKDILHRIANIRTAAEENLKIPDETVVSQAVAIDPATSAMLALLRETRIQEGTITKLTDEMQVMVAKQGLTRQFEQLMSGNSKTLENPLTLCMEMANLSVEGKNSILRITRFAYTDTQKELVDKVMAQFNKKAMKVDETTLSVAVDPSDVIKNTIDLDKGKRVIVFTARAKIMDNQIELNTNDYKAQKTFIEMAEKAGLVLNPTLSPKVMAMIDNVRAENAKPRHKGHSKQIIFVDNLSMHRIIRQALISQCGIPAAKIAIINGVEISNPIGLQDIQDGFNADGDDNKYQIIIANKKAEVGLNLQKGTQAIHHLTIGWTPDSIHQRNGRGVRQGNVLSYVAVYYYDQQGTFDEYKRNLVGSKSSWIDAVMKKGKAESNRVDIQGGMDSADYEAMIAATGSAEAVAAVEASRKERDKETRKKALKDKFTMVRAFMDKTIESSRKSRSDKEYDIYSEFFTGAIQVDERLRVASSKIKPEMPQDEMNKLSRQVSQLTAELSQMAAFIAPDLEGSETPDLPSFLTKARAGVSTWNSDYKRNPLGEIAKTATRMYSRKVESKPDNVMVGQVDARILSEQTIIANTRDEFMQLYPSLTLDQAQKIASGDAMLSANGTYAEAGYIGLLGEEQSFSFNKKHVYFLDADSGGLKCAREGSSRSIEGYADRPRDRENADSMYNMLIEAYAPDSIEYQTALDDIVKKDLAKAAELKADLYNEFTRQNILSGYFPELESRFKEESDNQVQRFGFAAFAPNNTSFPLMNLFDAAISTAGMSWGETRKVTVEEIAEQYGDDTVLYKLIKEYADKGYAVLKANRGLYFEAKGGQVVESRQRDLQGSFIVYAKTVKPRLNAMDLATIGIKDILDLIDDCGDQFDFTKPTSVPFDVDLPDMAAVKAWAIGQIKDACNFVVPEFFTESNAGSENTFWTRARKFSEIAAAVDAWKTKQDEGRAAKQTNDANQLAVNGFIGYRREDKGSFGMKKTMYYLAKAEGYNQKGRESPENSNFWEWTIPLGAWFAYVAQYPNELQNVVLIPPFVTQLRPLN